MNWTGRSLALRLTVWFLLLSAVPLAVVSMVIGVDVRGAIRGIVGQRHEALAGAMAQRWAEAPAEGQRWLRQRRPLHQALVVGANDAVAYGQDASWDGQPARHWFSAETLRAIHRQPRGTGEDANGRIYGYARVPRDDTDLVVVVFSAQGELDAPTAKLARSALSKLGASLLLVALAGGFLIWAAIGAPLHIFAQAAEAVADGDLATRVPPEVMDDELAALAVSFNHMTASLARSMADVEASEDRFRTMFDSLDDGVLVHDAETGLIIDANPAACLMFGTTREQCLGRTVVDFSRGDPPFDRATALAHCARAMAGQRQVFEWRCRRQDGSLFWAEVSLRRGLLDGQDRLLAVVRDTDARRQAEADLVESRRRMASMLDSTRLCAAMLDAGGRLLYCNAAFGQAIGAAPDQLIGADWFADMADDPDGELRAQFEAMVRAGEGEAHLEYNVVTRDGRRRCFVWDRTLLKDADGVVVGTSSLGRDVTDERELQERLRQSTKMEAIGQLAGGVAHDFNNLLTTILGYTEMMLAEPGPHAEELGEVLRAAERAGGLTHQLLAFSRKQMLSPRVWDLNTIVSGMERMLRRLIGEHIELVCELGRDVPPVTIDRGQMEQVLLNLAVNARDAMPQSGRLRLATAALNRVGPDGEPMPGACLVVSDSGSGMPAEVVDHIFEPFFTTKELGRGTGLGLSTVDGIVAQSGGTIRVESEVGHGTAFHIWLPGADPVDPPASEPERPEPSAAAPSSEGTVLVVEDDDLACGVVLNSLARSGFVVLLARDIDEARAIVTDHEGPIDLLLSDVVLPKASGAEVAATVTAMRPGLPVLFMSGYTADALGHHGVLDDGVELIEKPFSPAVLVERVRRMLGR
ncbi:MAG: PAS domain S-box protein [Armatimonadetes bacterium]|nr:PAS domain S-box protein [Armatimonadota bacterium]